MSHNAVVVQSISLFCTEHKMRTGRRLGPEEHHVSRTLFIVTFWLKENPQHEPNQKGTVELDFIRI
jgi:hypothetical protein